MYPVKSPRRPAGLPATLPRAAAEVTSAAARATEWDAGANPSWSSTSTATAGASHSARRECPRAPARRGASRASAATSTHSQALVPVRQAAAASRAPSPRRPETTASAAAVSSSVSSGSATTEPAVSRKTGLVTSRKAATLPRRGEPARRMTSTSVSRASPTLVALSAVRFQSPKTRSTAAPTK